jgi:23S rRNA (adenine2503-C2)-methyltransferase
MPLLPYFFDQDPDSLKAIMSGWGMPAFRSTQVLEWVYQKQVADPAKMTNLSAKDRQFLADNMVFTRSRVVAHQVATDGTQKLLVDWGSPDAPADVAPEAETKEPGVLARLAVHNAPSADGMNKGDSKSQTECVMIPAESSVTGRERKTACISSQVGCPVGCRFCASGIGGLDGNLSHGQIVEQVWRLSTLPGVERISNVVFMGMGEPLANFENVSRAIRHLMAAWATGISARKITVSTVGVPAQIRRLADLELPVTLALSLHAPNDQVRRDLIPWASYVTIQGLFDALAYYFEKTGREVTLEYILLRGVNDQQQHARELAQIANKLRANVNLIRYNEVKGMPFGRPDADDVHRFQEVLRTAGINTHIRASRGRDIAAACGQLRHEKSAG